jgi:hypothetical protein
MMALEHLTPADDLSPVLPRAETAQVTRWSQLEILRCVHVVRSGTPYTPRSREERNALTRLPHSTPITASAYERSAAITWLASVIISFAALARTGPREFRGR